MGTLRQRSDPCFYTHRRHVHRSPRRRFAPNRRPASRARIIGSDSLKRQSREIFCTRSWQRGGLGVHKVAEKRQEWALALRRAETLGFKRSARHQSEQHGVRPIVFRRFSLVPSVQAHVLADSTGPANENTGGGTFRACPTWNTSVSCWYDSTS